MSGSAHCTVSRSAKGNGFPVEAFAVWLLAAGADFLEPTAPGELVRFRLGDAAQPSCVLQLPGGRLRMVGLAGQAVANFREGRLWIGKRPPKHLRHQPPRLTIALRHALLARDGDACFYCGRPLGDDVCLEHLLAVTHGGSRRLENLALAHRRCNERGGDRAVAEKVRLREELRERRA